MATVPDPMPAADDVMAEVSGLLAELRPGAAEALAPHLDSRLDQELGLDSLARLELVARCERRFGHSLSQQSLAAIETPRDLLRSLASAGALRASFDPGAREPAAAVPAALGAGYGTGEFPDRCPTLLDVLDWHCERHRERRHLQMDDGEQAGEALSYGELRARARRVASALLERGLAPGEAVALMLPTEVDYFPCFLGVLMAGGIPAPLYPPLRFAKLADYLERQLGILDNCQARILVVPPQLKAKAPMIRALASGLRLLATPEELLKAPELELSPRRSAGDTVLLQYTSGSTASPKGVILSHAQLLANIRTMGKFARAAPEDVFVSWLPLYHDMGLIGAWLGSLYHGCTLVLMPPQLFLTRPVRWLWALHRYRGTISAAPNFAYELGLARVPDEDLAGLDLSAWRLALNGAEPVVPETLERFGARYGAYGLRAEALFPVYGLAEACLGLAFPPLGRGLKVLRVRREPLIWLGRVEAAGADEPDALRLASCGLPLPDCELRIVDADNRELPEMRQGRVQFQSPGATSGYYRNAEATRKLFVGDWLETGDLGFIAEGELYITGRSKDLIIRAGRNIHPQELEAAIGALPGIRKGRVAVFGSTDPRQGTERLVVMAETPEREPAARAALIQAVNGAVLALVAMPPDEIVLAPPGSVLKTSSGKLRRSSCREQYESGRVGSASPLAFQLAGLALRRFGPWARRRASALADLAYAAWAWSVFALLAPPIWLAVLTLPGEAQRYGAVRGALRLLARATGVAVKVEGRENLPASGGCVLAVNHASYLDGLVLAGVLPWPYAVFAKAELAGRWSVRTALSRLGAIFVQRGDADQAAAAAEAAEGQARPLLVFAEGTFTRSPGLRPFRMGAFLVAARTGRPLVPIAIRGSRNVMRGATWFPRRGEIRVVIGPALAPAPGAEPWAEAARLRDAARSFILRHCGEPDLEALSSPIDVAPASAGHGM